jgi:iron complex transport system permease protein
MEKMKGPSIEGREEVSLSERQMVVGYLKKVGHKISLLLVLLFLVLVTLALALSIGVLKIPVVQVLRALAAGIFGSVDVDGQTFLAIWNIRLPRALTAIFAGMGLAMAGAVMQSLLHNPMASPFTLGISAGAGLGASIAIIFGVGIPFAGSSHIVGNAFVFALMLSAVILLIARIKQINPRSLILAGIAMMYLANAMMTTILYFADSYATREVMFWLVGSLGKADWESFFWISSIFVVVFFLMWIFSQDINRLMLGDDAARSLGVSVERLRTVIMVMVSLLVGGIVAFIGGIGFLGLVAPHLARMIIGSDNRFTLPGAALFGGLLLLAADTFALNAFSPVVLPVGVVTSFIGSPLFIYLIIHNKKYM